MNKQRINTCMNGNIWTAFRHKCLDNHISASRVLEMLALLWLQDGVGEILKIKLGLNKDDEYNGNTQ
jgi:hypothetical protein